MPASGTSAREPGPNRGASSGSASTARTSAAIAACSRRIEAERRQREVVGERARALRRRAPGQALQQAVDQAPAAEAAGARRLQRRDRGRRVVGEPARRAERPLAAPCGRRRAVQPGRRLAARQAAARRAPARAGRGPPVRGIGEAPGRRPRAPGSGSSGRARRPRARARSRPARARWSPCRSCARSRRRSDARARGSAPT